MLPQHVAVTWDPDRYERFAAERSRPFWDLAALVEPEGVGRAVDLGCGTGALTARLAEALGVASMVGVDSSPEMLAEAEAHATDVVGFELGDLATWPSPGDEPVDLVFANASLHWVPDHEAVIRRWVGGLAPGGQLAVQVPANAHHPAHRLTDELARREPYRTALGGDPPPDAAGVNVLPPARYAALLHDLGAVEQTVRLQVYAHELDSVAAVTDFVGGSSMRRITSRLPDELAARFVDDHRRELRARTGDVAPYLYTFERILFRARW